MAIRMVGEGVPFERTRRITGYLVGTLDRFNNAKRAEERDRVKHDADYKPREGAGTQSSPSGHCA
ncbi:MAG: anaerobic ribonucleoside-triphosphate reductase [Porticoccaceae bacterium]